MLPRLSTALALLLVMLGMLWLGDACCDDPLDNDPVGAVQSLRYNVDSRDKRTQAAGLPVWIAGYKTQVSVKRIGYFTTDPTVHARHRPQKHAVRGPPFFSV